MRNYQVVFLRNRFEKLDSLVFLLLPPYQPSTLHQTNKNFHLAGTFSMRAAKTLRLETWKFEAQKNSGSKIKLIKWNKHVENFTLPQNINQRVFFRNPWTSQTQEKIRGISYQKNTGNLPVDPEVPGRDLHGRNMRRSQGLAKVLGKTHRKRTDVNISWEFSPFSQSWLI